MFHHFFCQFIIVRSDSHCKHRVDLLFLKPCITFLITQSSFQILKIHRTRFWKFHFQHLCFLPVFYVPRRIFQKLIDLTKLYLTLEQIQPLCRHFGALLLHRCLFYGRLLLLRFLFLSFYHMIILSCPY